MSALVDQAGRARHISFDVSREDAKLIAKIVDRANKLGLVVRNGKTNVIMSITACHANGCPLRLADLLAADDFNLAHDVLGIDRHICHETGQLLRCFLPRFAEKNGRPS